MGTSVTRTKSATWVVAPPDSEADVGEVLAGYLERIGAGRGSALVSELVSRTLEAARRTGATGGDLAAALVTAVLDSFDAASRTSPGARTPTAGRRRLGVDIRAHLERGAATSATPETTTAWLPRIVAAVEGLVDQCGDDPEHVALLTAAMMLVDVGGGLEDRFSCAHYGVALVTSIAAGLGDLATRESLAGVRALVEANAAFETGIDLHADGDPVAAVRQFRRARSRFLEAGLRVEAAVALSEQAHVESATLDAPDAALRHWAAARKVLVEHGRDVEVARGERDVAFAVARRRGPAAADETVTAAAGIFESRGLVRDLVLCDVVRACLAREDGHRHAAADHLDHAATRLHGLGLEERAAQLRLLARRGDPAPE
ncbi:MAG: hypothetical protein U0U69_09130 [Acidimicrobiia bacterium]